MVAFNKGRYRVDVAASERDLADAQRLRAMAFRGSAQADDRDDLDPITTHILVRDETDNTAVAAFRLMVLARGPDIAQSYAAQHYGLGNLAAFPGKMLELGRMCQHPSYTDPDILRAGWAAITRIVDDQDVQLLFGCSSFAGTDPSVYAHTLALLHARHLAPSEWQPEVKSPDIVRLNGALTGEMDRKLGLKSMPALLKSYLKMGAWVSDHAVVDHDLNTLHVFTGLEVRRVPQTRQRILRRVAS